MTEKRVVTGYKKFMNDEEVRELITFVNKNCTEQIKLIFHILVYMGLRVGEAVRLDRQNIQGNKLVFELEKSHRIHERVIPGFLLIELMEYIRRYNIQDGYLFSTKYSYKYNGGKEHIQTTTLSIWIKRFRDTSGKLDFYYTRNYKDSNRKGGRLYRISLHTLRHWFLTKTYEKSNGDVLLVADIIGHKKLETTFQYLRAWKKLQREQELVNKVAVAI